MVKKVNKNETEPNNKRLRSALSPEIREQQLCSLAYDIAEKQLLDGTASSAVITHFLKISSIKEKKELELMESKKKLLDSRIDDIEISRRNEATYAEILEAMKTYSGYTDDDDDDVVYFD